MNPTMAVFFFGLAAYDSCRADPNNDEDMRDFLTIYGICRAKNLFPNKQNTITLPAPDATDGRIVWTSETHMTIDGHPLVTSRDLRGVWKELTDQPTSQTYGVLEYMGAYDKMKTKCQEAKTNVHVNLVYVYMVAACDNLLGKNMY